MFLKNQKYFYGAFDKLFMKFFVLSEGCVKLIYQHSLEILPLAVKHLIIYVADSFVDSHAMSFCSLCDFSLERISIKKNAELAHYEFLCIPKQSFL